MIRHPHLEILYWLLNTD
uniref:Uncharacterized protein n=1 Tax=Rhizophora mucronata TaxID=61149 RepID=A0A2P2J0A8_RHIMU